MITLCLGLMLLVLASSAFVALRKRTSPQKQPPLPPHPSTLIVPALTVGLSAWRDLPQLR